MVAGTFQPAALCCNALKLLIFSVIAPLAFMYSLQHPAHASAHSARGDFSSSCGNVLSSAKSRLIKELKTAFGVKPGSKHRWNAVRIAGTPFRLLFYPAVGPIKTGYKAYDHVKSGKKVKNVWKSFFQVLREDYLLIAGFLLLIQMNDDEIVMSYVFDSSTPEFDQGNPDDLLVVVNIMAPGDLGFEFVESLVDAKYSRYKNKAYIEVDSLEDMLKQLDLLSKERGQIARLDIVGHGDVGKLFIGKAPYNSIDFLSSPQLTGVFSPEAQIRVSTCFTGRGADGDAALDGLADVLLDQGGTIYASTVAYYPTDQAPFLVGLGDGARNAFRFLAKGPAALDVLLEKKLGISHFGLSSYSGVPNSPRTESKIKRRDYEVREPRPLFSLEQVPDELLLRTPWATARIPQTAK